MTVLELIQRSAEYLAKKGVDSPRLQAELLLAFLLKMPRMQLYLNFERVLSSSELDQFRDLVKRRGQREPLQHIVGSASFCGLEIIVNRQVLIPRAETELLAEMGWKFLNDITSSVGHGAGSPVALDFGTGSGCLAVALATKCPTAKVHALDISKEALEVARQNASRHGLTDRIQFWLGDGLAGLPGEQEFNLIIGNPPYVPSDEIEVLQPEVSDYDPHTALDGGPDGLNHYRSLAARAGQHLRPGGRIMLEFGDEQQERVQQIFAGEKWIVEKIIEDYTRRPRIIIARKN